MDALGQHDCAALHSPAQAYLRRRYSVPPCDLRELRHAMSKDWRWQSVAVPHRFVGQHAWLIRPLEVRSAQRRIAFHLLVGAA